MPCGLGGSAFGGGRSRHLTHIWQGVVEFRFGGRGSCDEGQLRTPWGVAVGGGTVYIADSWTDRIARFTTQGAWLGAWGEHGREPGQFDLPIGVAVCEGGLASVLVVSEQGGKRVQLLSAADGAPLGQLALGGSVVVRMVSAHNGRICVADPGRHRVYVLRLIDWLARWRAIALAWAPLRTWRQRAADRAFSPGGMGYKGAAASFSSMVGRDLRGDLLDAAEST